MAAALAVRDESSSGLAISSARSAQGLICANSHPVHAVERELDHARGAFIVAFFDRALRAQK
jgi:hypothetical protein